MPTGCLELLTAATELRPGTYIYNDAATVWAGAARWAWVWTTVVSMPTPDRAVVDAGSKTLAGGRIVWTSPQAFGPCGGVAVRGARRDSRARWRAHRTAGGRPPVGRSQPRVHHDPLARRRAFGRGPMGGRVARGRPSGSGPLTAGRHRSGAGRTGWPAPVDKGVLQRQVFEGVSQLVVQHADMGALHAE